jgi:hypothetical protein
MMACEILRHGIVNDASELPTLVALYDTFLLTAPLDIRKEIYGHVKMIVQDIGGWTAGAFTPFMLLDEDIGIVSTATIDYSSLGTLLENDPMTRPRDAVDMVVKGIPRNPAAVIGGLLALGDPRVCTLVAPLCRTLNDEQTGTVARCFSGLTAKCVVTFYLDWLEELAGREDADGVNLFGSVAAGLYNLSVGSKVSFIRDGLRPFPVPGGENPTAWSSSWRIDAAEFARSIEGRLHRLEKQERSPRIIPHVIRAFGLAPREVGVPIPQSRHTKRAKGALH